MKAQRSCFLACWLTLALVPGPIGAAVVTSDERETEVPSGTQRPKRSPRPSVDGIVYLNAEARLVMQTLREEPKPANGPSFQTFPELRAPAQAFFDRYFTYSAIVERRSRQELARCVQQSKKFLDQLVTCGRYRTHNLLNPRTCKAREAPEAVQARREWLSAYDVYRSAAQSKLETMAIDRARTMVVVVKSEYLAYLIGLDTKLSLLAFPISYGSNPYGDNKLRVGDGRTPSTERAILSNIYPVRDEEMIGVWLGITVRNPRRPGTYWSQGENLGLHGTPEPESIGMKASHGCVRMFEEDSRFLSRFVREGTPIVIRP